MNADEMHAPCSLWENVFTLCLCIEIYYQEEGRDDKNLGHVAEIFSRKFSVCYCIHSLKFFYMSYFYNQKGQEATKLKIQTSACMKL